MCEIRGILSGRIFSGQQHLWHGWSSYLPSPRFRLPGCLHKPQQICIRWLVHKLVTLLIVVFNKFFKVLSQIFDNWYACTFSYELRTVNSSFRMESSYVCIAIVVIDVHISMLRLMISWSLSDSPIPLNISAQEVFSKRSVHQFISKIFINFVTQLA